MKVKSLSRVRLLATPWTAAYQAPLSMGFSRQEYRNGVPLPSPYIKISNGNCENAHLYSKYSDSARLRNMHVKLMVRNILMHTNI